MRIGNESHMVERLFLWDLIPNLGSIPNFLHRFLMELSLTPSFLAISVKGVVKINCANSSLEIRNFFFCSFFEEIRSVR